MGSELVPSPAECDKWQASLIHHAGIGDLGDLSEARVMALEALQAGCDEVTLSELYRQNADQMLADSSLLNYESNLTRHRPRRVQAVVDPAKCWTSSSNDGVNVVLYLWDKCCSQVQGKDNVVTKQNSMSDFFLEQASRSRVVHGISTKNKECTVEGRPFCCEFHARTRSYLRLPAIREVALRVRVESDDRFQETFDLEQDGFLRPFDVAGILWPSGYFLALCVAAPKVCSIPELDKVATSNETTYVLELGAGIGLPSIAFSRMLARREMDQQRPKFKVVAADKAAHALSLTATNARAANASVTTVLLDHFNKTAIQSTFRGRRFSVILGSALQSLFDESTREKEHPLWNVLDILLDDSRLAVILLSHTIHTLEVPVDGKFTRIRTISGNQLGMNTGNGEDFLISVFQRSRHTALNQNEEL